MDREDPISQFFPADESVNLYAVLNIHSDAKIEDIRKSYRRLALVHHPDKHATSSEDAKASASIKFQQVGFAYSVLSDEKRRKRYDKTGKTDEGLELDVGEDGWEAYFEELFDRVTRGKLDDMKREYQGSAEETEDIINAYNDTSGAIADIMTMIPHSTHDDEARFIILITNLIEKGKLESLPLWKSSVADEKSRLVRQKQSAKEAKEAEDLAKELGVWDEFYGSGKTGVRKGKGKSKQTEATGHEEEDHSALQALILKKRKNMDGFFDNLAEKYGGPEAKEKGKKRGKREKRAKVSEEETGEGEDAEPPKKRAKRAGAIPPEIDDKEFEELQQKLFGDKAKNSSQVTGSRPKRTGKEKKMK